MNDNSRGRSGGGRGRKQRNGDGNGSVKISPAMIAELNKLVKKTIEKQEEVKISFGSQTCNVGGYNYTNWASNQIHVVTPYDGTFGSCVINQGTGQADRVGNIIKIRKATIRLASWVMPYQAITNPTPTPLMVRVWIFTRKDYQNIPTNLPNFFQAGNSSIAPIGNITDYLYPINTDVYTVYKTVDFKLGTASFTNATGGQPTYGYYANNDFELCDLRTIDVTPYLPSKIEWNDTTALPFSRPVFLTFEAVCADGTTQSSGTYGAQIAMQTVLEYSDA